MRPGKQHLWSNPSTSLEGTTVLYLKIPQAEIDPSVSFLISPAPAKLAASPLALDSLQLCNATLRVKLIQRLGKISCKDIPIL
jgi:hypothetical protein